MSTYKPWSRRQFLQYTGTLTAAVSGLPTMVRASLLSPSPRQRYAYVGSAEGSGSLHVFAVDENHWTPLQSVASAQPGALALHPFANVLYVANHVSVWRGLPCGLVEAYKIGPLQGTLTKLGHQPLSLSATLPTDLAVSPDGRHLVVACHGGGAYNLLPLGADGGLERVAGIVKETGCGPHPHHQQAAHPHTVLFDPAGVYVLGCDVGADRLTSFRLDEGSLARTVQVSLPEGAGPSHMAFHPSGHLLYVCNQLQSSITGFAYHASEGRVGKELWSAPLSLRSAASPSLAIHPSGRFLYTFAEQEEVAVWKIDPHTGELRRTPQPRSDLDSGSILKMGPQGRSLYTLHEASGEIRETQIHQLTGRLAQPRTVAVVSSPRSLLFGRLTSATA